MEVHHAHQATHKRKWTEYLLEFFMLFLAVFLGFLAENQREHIVEHKREKQFMQSLVKDLQLDTAYISTCLRAINARQLSIDSVLDYFQKYREESKVPFSTVRQMKRGIWDQVFWEHTGTIDQLKFSGGLRLVRKRQAVDSIEAYYQQLNRYSMTRLSYRSNQDLAFELTEKVFNAFDHIIYMQDSSIRNYSQTMKINRIYLNDYLNLLIRLRNASRNDVNFLNATAARARNLMDLIRKEYHLE